MTFFLLLKKILNIELSKEHRKLNMIDYIQDIDSGKFTIIVLIKIPDEKK